MQYVLMAVPTQLVADVADLLAGFEVSSDTLEKPSDQPVTGTDELIQGWTEKLVRRAFQESADPMRQVLLFFADHAGEEVTSMDIAAHIDAEYGWNTVAGMLGAFGRRSVNRYERELPMWEFRWDADGKGRLKMPAAVADVIKSAADE